MDATNAAAERFRVTLELFETGVELKRAALQRAHPGIPATQLEELLGVWLRHRPGAPEGDGPPRAS